MMLLTRRLGILFLAGGIASCSSGEPGRPDGVLGSPTALVQPGFADLAEARALATSAEDGCVDIRQRTAYGDSLVFRTLTAPLRDGSSLRALLNRSGAELESVRVGRSWPSQEIVEVSAGRDGRFVLTITDPGRRRVQQPLEDVEQISQVNALVAWMEGLSCRVFQPFPERS